MPNPKPKPIIGISTSRIQRNGRDYSAVAHFYAQSVLRADAVPLLIPLCDETELAADYATAIDGLVLSGGNEDVNPLLYNEPPIPALQCVMPQRDSWEMALLDAAVDRGKPILGICRGAQVINVAMGGSLYQNIGVQLENIQGHFPKETAMNHLWHKVSIEPQSKLSVIFNRTEILVNSFHNQAVKDIAPGFKATAHAEDGIVEAIESRDHDFLVAVQWHPEALTGDHPQFVELFRALTQACLETGALP